MHCPIKSEDGAGLLLDYCARRLDAETTILLERHMETCADCRELAGRQQAVWSALNEWRIPHHSPDFDRRLYLEMERARFGSPVRMFLRRLLSPLSPAVRRPAFSVAAACLMLAAGLLIEYPGLRYASRNARHSAPAADGISVQPEQVEITLDDMEMLRELHPPARVEENTSKSM